MTTTTTDPLAALIARETDTYRAAHPESARLRERARDALLDGVPLHWMDLYALPFPFYLRGAAGNRVRDVDGNEYLDFGLCGTAALWGHAGDQLLAELAEDPDGGVVTGWPGEDSVRAGQNLAGRFGLPLWQFTLSATDANRAALRLARLATGRTRVLAFTGSYHGSIDELTLPDGTGRPATAAVVEFNDPAALERALAAGDVAAVITEPALTTSGGIVLPDHGFHRRLRELTRDAGTLLVIDETQTIVAGPGGVTATGLDPDLLVIGKSFALGLPIGAVGMTRPVAAAFHAHTHPSPTEVNLGGLGNTLSGGQLPMRLARRCLETVMTEPAYARMGAHAARLAEGLDEAVRRSGLGWSVTRLGAMVSCSFLPHPPRNGGELLGAAHDPMLRGFLFLYLANRGVLLGCFGGAAVVAPHTTAADVDALLAAATDAITEIRELGARGAG